MSPRVDDCHHRCRPRHPRPRPDQTLPDILQAIARIIPLTYLADALRQVMVGGTAFAPLWLCAAVLAGWLVTCFGIAALKFRWQ